MAGNEQANAPLTLESVNEQIAVPLKATQDETKLLMRQLALLPKEDALAVAAETQKTAEARTQKEAFVPADTVKAIPALSRSVDALSDFLQVATGEIPGPLTAREVAAASNRYEPFDQLGQSVRVLNEAVETVRDEKAKNGGDVTRLSAVADQAAKVIASTDAIYNSNFGDRPVDGLFLDAVEKIQNGAEVARHQQAAQAQANADQTLQQIYDGQIRENQQAVLAATDELQKGLAKLPAAEKENLEALLKGYQQQVNPSVDPGAALNSIDAYSAGVKALASGMKKITENTAEALTPEEHAAASSPSAAFGALRDATRAVQSALNAANDNGRYDKLLEDAAIVSAHAWEVRKAMDGPLAAKVTEETAKFAPPPSTALEAASAEPVVPQPELKRA